MARVVTTLDLNGARHPRLRTAEPVREEAFRIIGDTYRKPHHKSVMPFAP